MKSIPAGTASKSMHEADDRTRERGSSARRVLAARRRAMSTRHRVTPRDGAGGREDQVRRLLDIRRPCAVGGRCVPLRRTARRKSASSSRWAASAHARRVKEAASACCRPMAAISGMQWIFEAGATSRRVKPQSGSNGRCFLRQANSSSDGPMAAAALYVDRSSTCEKLCHVKEAQAAPASRCSAAHARRGRPPTLARRFCASDG